jgi:hypothetical protein
MLQLKNEVTALRQRVLWIEKALKPKQAKATLRDGRAHTARQDAEDDARSRARSEYYEQKTREFYANNPESLKWQRDHERELDAYLRERGFKPEPTRIPKGLPRTK